MNRLVLTVALFLSALIANAQDQPEMAETMRSEGKIYVVIAVIALIFVAIVAFLAYLERRVKRMEKKLGENK
jgi:hypothetical protein